MRTIVFTLLLAFVAACSLVFDSKGSSSNTSLTTDGGDYDPADAFIPNDHWHPGDGGEPSEDGGCGSDPDANTGFPDAEPPADADYPYPVDAAPPSDVPEAPDAHCC